MRSRRGTGSTPRTRGSTHGCTACKDGPCIAARQHWSQGAIEGKPPCKAIKPCRPARLLVLACARMCAHLTAISASQAPAIQHVDLTAGEQRIAVYSPPILSRDGRAELPCDVSSTQLQVDSEIVLYSGCRPTRAAVARGSRWRQRFPRRAHVHMIGRVRRSTRLGTRDYLIGRWRSLSFPVWHVCARCHHHHWHDDRNKKNLRSILRSRSELV